MTQTHTPHRAAGRNATGLASAWFGPARPSLQLLGVVSMLLAGGCRSDPEQVVPPSPSPTPSTHRPVDRLTPGELAEGKQEVFGLAVPKSLKIDADFGDTVHLRGNASAEAVANYIRERVLVRHVEIGAGATIFPRAKIKGGDPKRLVRIDIRRQHSEVSVRIRDLTPPPTTQGLTETERWKRAGMTPTGELVDPTTIE